MKATLILIPMVVIAYLVLVARADGSAVLALRSAGRLSADFLPILALALLLMGAVDALLPKELLERWLSDAAGWRGVLVGWLAGIVTPAGSLLGLPFAAVLYKAGVGAAVLVTYLTSLSTLSLVKLPIEIGLLGNRLALARFAACLLLPLLAGALTRGVLALSTLLAR